MGIVNRVKIYNVFDFTKQTFFSLNKQIDDGKIQYFIHHRKKKTMTKRERKKVYRMKYAGWKTVCILGLEA